jgi:hypothetical protein
LSEGEKSAKLIAYHSILVATVFLGIFLGTLPDLFPDVLLHCPYFRMLHRGVATLSTFPDETSNSDLNRDDKAYKAIYKLLRSVDPHTLPPLKETLALQGDKYRCNIKGVKSGEQWNAVAPPDQKSKRTMEPIYICFRTPQNIAEPICSLEDLKFLVRDVETRVCSRLGFFLAFVALILGEGMALRKAIISRLKNRI